MDKVQLADLPVVYHPLLHQRVRLHELLRLALVPPVEHVKEVSSHGLFLVQLLTSQNNLLHVDGMLDLLAMLFEVILARVIDNFILVGLLIQFIIHKEVSWQDFVVLLE